MKLSNSYSLVFHLGMSGRLRVYKIINYKFAKHDHILLFINNREILSFNDPRRFGFVDLLISKDIYKKKYIIKLGLDPFDIELNCNYLLNKINNSKVPIKQILLDQRIIAGIGNIYASEILYDAKISPFTSGFHLDNDKT